MYKEIIKTITSTNEALRNRSEEELLDGLNREELLQTAEGLESFRCQTKNLYHKVRAALFLYAICRFYLMEREDEKRTGRMPYEGVKAVLERRFEEAVEIFLTALSAQGCNKALLSALAASYYSLAFQVLVDQVKLSISQSRGNETLFQTPSLKEYPFRTPAFFTQKDAHTGLYPIGWDQCPVRADPCHSGWSDIFFLGMDFPLGARVINLSVDLGVRFRPGEILPPAECFTRVIEKRVIRLVSVDLKCSKDVQDLEELFNFGNDHLSLLKAGVVASGVVPPSLEGSSVDLPALLEVLLGKPAGFELVTKVNHLPKGSRLAVSTTLLCTIITRLMRFSGQAKHLEGSLGEEERRLVASRAILGEWLGGSGGGWQDSGGIWPGIKVITGAEAAEGDPEFGVSRGRLLPLHTPFSREEFSKEAEERICRSIVMVHGGMSQNVGPILEMVTVKYLLRCKEEWKSRLREAVIFDRIVEATKRGDGRELGRLTTLDWNTATKVIIPWTTNAFTESLISRMNEEFGEDCWGFLMLGGMSGGGMAFIVNPDVQDRFAERVLSVMRELKEFYQDALPFAMDPVVFNFRINQNGILSKNLCGEKALLPPEYYQYGLQNEIGIGDGSWVNEHRRELEIMGEKVGAKEKPGKNPEKLKGFYAVLFPQGDNELKERAALASNWEEEAERIKRENGFDKATHRRTVSRLKRGEIGLARNRLPLSTGIEDCRCDDVQWIPQFEREPLYREFLEKGEAALRRHEAAVVTLSGGLGTRWTEGAPVVKAINPFSIFNGKHRCFTEVHLAKSRRAHAVYGHPIQHVFTTSFLTHEAFVRHLKRNKNFRYEGPIHLSPAQAIGHRVYPMERDLRFLWEELSQQKLAEQAQKVLEDLHESLIEWAKEKGEGEEYTDNIPIQRFNPPGHWHEIPNMLKNGVLARLIRENPDLKYLLVHNTDTLGAWLDPVVLGVHIRSGKTFSFEVTPRRFEDKGGGLARVKGRVMLIEGLALPREEDEFKLSFYNTLTNWITIDGFLTLLGLNRDNILRAEKDSGEKKRALKALRELEDQVPTYVTIKEVKLIWGSGQEDIFPVAQFEKLWGDITGLEGVDLAFLAVDRGRGQQLKDPSQLDPWVADGSRDFICTLADFQ